MTALVSVIIPTYGAAEGLEACLAALSRQTYPRDRFEIIVADNGAAIAPHPEIVVVREPRPGSYAARNAGLRVARGEIIAFTDDDCIPEPEWLDRGVASVVEHGVVAGGVELVAPRPIGVSPAAYLYSAILTFHAGGFARNGGYGATANLFVRRAILDEVGPFDTTYLSGGDMDWGKRARALGYRTHNAPAARVMHQARASVAAILRREMRLAGGNQLSRARNAPSGRVRAIADLADAELRRELRWALGELRRATTGEPLERLSVAPLVVLVQAVRALERVRVLFGGAPRRA